MKTYTYKERLLIAKETIEDMLKNDSYDWTSKYWEIHMKVAINQLEEARKIIK